MGRTFDIDDIILNTIGAYIGYVIYRIVTKNEKSILNRCFGDVAE